MLLLAVVVAWFYCCNDLLRLFQSQRWRCDGGGDNVVTVVVAVVVVAVVALVALVAVVVAADAVIVC